MKSYFDKLDELADGIRGANQGLASLEQDTRQPHLAMEVDVPGDKNTRKRTEGAATLIQTMHGDSFFANRAKAGPTFSTGFGIRAEPPALHCRNDVSVGNAAAAPKLCLSPLEMGKPTATCGLLSTNKTSTATRTTYYLLPLWFCLIEEISLIISIKHIRLVLHQLFLVDNSQQAPFWPRCIGTKSGQNLVFDPSGSTGHFRACMFLGMWRALLCGNVYG
jgi:hypothetical protein